MSVYVIAECASAHDGSLEKARRLIDLAKRAGANMAKFQFWSDADRLADRRQVKPIFRAHYRAYRMPADWLPVLKGECDRWGLEFGCTVYLPEDVPIVAPFVERWKVASFESGALDLRDAIGEADPKPLILSTGMLPGEAINPTRGKWNKATCSLKLLHCVSGYPAPVKECNLAAIRAYKLQGFSDHTADDPRSVTGPAVRMGDRAVQAGSEIVEFHVRLEDTDRTNLDWLPAKDLIQAEYYVRYLRESEAVYGDGRKRLMDSEQPMARYRVTA